MYPSFLQKKKYPSCNIIKSHVTRLREQFIHNHVFNCRDTIESGTKIRLSQPETLFGRKPAPVMASFSSRGPNQVQPYILKVLLYTWICYILVRC